MGKQYSRVQRGQVYWFDPSQAYGEGFSYIAFNGREYPSSVQNKNRPWLVVSNNEGNNSSPTCNIVPITLEEKTRIPTHVQFNYEGKQQTILCEQVRTVDCLALSEYIYTVQDSVLQEVERALQIQFQIRAEISYTDITMDNVVKKLETIVEKIIQSKEQEIKAQTVVTMNPSVTPEMFEEAALNLGVMLEGIMVTPQPEKQEPVKEVKAEEKPAEIVKEPPKKITSGMSAVDKFNARYGTNPSVPKSAPKKDELSVSEKDTKKKRNSWTVESRRRFLEDCGSMSTKEVMAKYGFKNVQSVFQTKYACKNALGITD